MPAEQQGGLGDLGEFTVQVGTVDKSHPVKPAAGRDRRMVERDDVQAPGRPGQLPAKAAQAGIGNPAMVFSGDPTGQ